MIISSMKGWVYQSGQWVLVVAASASFVQAQTGDSSGDAWGDKYIDGTLTIQSQNSGEGDLSVEGNAAVEGYFILQDAAVGSANGVSMQFFDRYQFYDEDDGMYEDDPSEIYFLNNQREVRWTWGHAWDSSSGDYVPQMVLTEDGVLELYDRIDVEPYDGDGLPGIELDPRGKGEIRVDGNKVLVNQAEGYGAFAGGYFNNSASGGYGFAYGAGVEANGSFSVALGQNATANGYRSFASNGTSNGRDSVVFSYGVTGADASGAMAVGGVTANGSHALVMGGGWSNRPYDSDYSLAMISSGDYAFAFGQVALTEADFSYASGQLVRARGIHSFAFGRGESGGEFFGAINHEANGDYSVVIGELNVANGKHAHAIGEGLRVDAIHSTAIGRYNANLCADGTSPNSSLEQSTDPIFEVGNGTAVADPSTALTVYRDGNVLLSNNLAVEGAITLKNHSGDVSMGPFTAGSQ